MNFKEWLSYKKITIKQACDELGFSQVHMSYILNYHKPTSIFMIGCIKTYTNNEANTDDLILKDRKDCYKYGKGSVFFREKNNRYQAYLNKKYIGFFKTKHDAELAIKKHKL